MTQQELINILQKAAEHVGYRFDFDDVDIDAEDKVISIKGKVTDARIDELLQMRKVGDDIAAKDDTDFEDLSGAYDGHILKRLADLTAPKSDTNLVSEGEI